MNSSVTINLSNKQPLSGGLRNTASKKKYLPGKPLVSVITVVYNRVDNLAATLTSVADQKYVNVEYIIIDGGSTDGTVDVIKKHESLIDYWISEPDSGIYDAMNKGIDKASGDWINFMNCGDRFASSDALSFFEDGHAADIIYGDALIEYGSFNVMWRRMPMDEMWKRTPFCHQACFVKAPIMKAYKFDLSFRLSSDFDFLYKAWLDGKKFIYVDKVICYYDNRDGASKKYELLSFKERRHAVMRRDHTFSQWLYYVKAGSYLMLASFIKGIIGERLTTWVTRTLKQ